MDDAARIGTERERFLRVMRFEPVDHGFNFELPLWTQTYDRWLGEGMPEDVTVGDLMRGCEFFGIPQMGYLPLKVLEMMPAFEEEVLEEDERYRIQRHRNGVVTKALKEGELRGMRMSMDTYIGFPVTDRDSWRDVKRRYRADSPARQPEWWPELGRSLRGRGYPMALTHNGCFGLYSFMRTLMGTETACTVFYDDPALAEEILDTLTDYLIEVTRPALEAVEVDYFNYFEDFAYKTGPLVGPNIFREYLAPRYRRFNDHLRSHGVQHIWLDSDGNTEVLIPHFIDVGITFHWPLERASDMDPLAIRKRYGRAIGLGGGIDKRALAKGPKAIEEELYHHVPQLLEDGGYLPTVDHAVPPDISYENWLYYLTLKYKLLGIDPESAPALRGDRRERGGSGPRASRKRGDHA